MASPVGGLRKHGSQTMLEGDVAMEKLTLAVEGLQLSEAGRAFSRTVLGEMDPGFVFETAWPSASQPTLDRLLRKAHRGALPELFAQAVRVRWSELPSVAQDALRELAPAR